MCPSPLAVFFGRLATAPPEGSAQASDLGPLIRRAAAESGHRALRALQVGKPPWDQVGIAAAVRSSPRIFGEFESEQIAAALGTRPLAEVAGPAAEHYARRAQIDATAQAAVVVPVLALCALWALTTLLCVCVLPRFGEALAALGAAKPMITRGVLYAAVLFRVLVQPVLLSVGLLVLVLVAYWRSPEGQARLSRALLRLPWLGELFAQWVSARFCTNLRLCCRLGRDVADAVHMASAAVPCEPLRAAAAAPDKHPSHGPFAWLTAALGQAHEPEAPALLAEVDLLQQRLSLSSRRLVLAGQGLLAVGTVGLCLVVLWATYLPVARFHDSVMR